jgi:hypothetical protein
VATQRTSTSSVPALPLILSIPQPARTWIAGDSAAGLGEMLDAGSDGALDRDRWAASDAVKALRLPLQKWTAKQRSRGSAGGVPPPPATRLCVLLRTLQSQAVMVVESPTRSLDVITSMVWMRPHFSIAQ